MSIVSDVSDFHKKFGLSYTDGPRELPASLAHFRSGFLAEELTEYCRACESGDLEGQLDALVDLVYVAVGTAYLQGFDFQAAWDRVHTANMAKVRAERAEQSKRGSKFDVVKPAGWTAPVLTDLVEPSQQPRQMELPL